MFKVIKQRFVPLLSFTGSLAAKRIFLTIIIIINIIIIHLFILKHNNTNYSWIYTIN